MINDQYESGYIATESGEEVSEKTLPLSLTDEKAIRDIIDKESLQLASNIVISNDDNEINNYLEKFNKNMSKKNLLRILKMNELWDKVSDEALDRIDKHPDELTPTELVNFIKLSQEAINNSKNDSTNINNIAPITLNQQNNTVNVNVESAENVRIDRRSKEKIMEAVSKLLNISLEGDSGEVVDVIEESDKENE